MAELPTLRWGIVGCGQISSYFTMDLVGSVNRPGATTRHIVQAIGSSSIKKGDDFVSAHCASQEQKPKVYDSYAGVYADPEVDVVYIGTPHVLHCKNALDAIAAGKHVVCEKPLAMNAAEVKQMADAAKAKGVYLLEALWTRFFPLAKKFQSLLHEDKVIGDIGRVSVDFSLPMPISKSDPSARTASKALGAGSLLDIGYYSLLWASLALDGSNTTTEPTISSSMIFHDESKEEGRFDEAFAAVFSYKDLKAQATTTASLFFKTGAEFAVVEGSKGSIIAGGMSASRPDYLLVRVEGKEEERLDFPILGIGVYFEQDAVAEDLRAGRTESETCPVSSSLTLLSRADEIRRQNNLVYAADAPQKA